MLCGGGEVEINVLQVYGPHMIGVRLSKEREEYFQFERRLSTLCSDWFGGMSSEEQQKYQLSASDLQKLDFDEDIILWSGPSGWHRGKITSFFKDNVGLWLVDKCKDVHDKCFNCYKIPQQLQQEVLQRNAFAFFIHLTQLPRITSASQVTDTVKEMLHQEKEKLPGWKQEELDGILPESKLDLNSYRAHELSTHLLPIYRQVIESGIKNQESLRLVQRARPVKLEKDLINCSSGILDRSCAKNEIFSLPAEIIWTEIGGDSEKENPFSPDKPRSVTLSQYLLKGFVKYDEDDIVNDTTEYEDEQNHFEEDQNHLDDLESVRFNDDIFSAGDKDVQIDKSVMNLINNCSSPQEEAKKTDEDARLGWKEAKLPTESQFLARGTHVDNAGQIYVHLFSNKNQFRRVRRKLAEKFKRKDLPDSDDENEAKEVFEEQDEVAVFYKHDQCWYRGRFLNYVEGTKDREAQVFFVDWGNVSKVDARVIRKEVPCQDVPILSFKVVLHDVLPADGKEWSRDAIDFIYGKTCYCYFGGNDNIIKIVNMSSEIKQPLLVDIQVPGNKPTSGAEEEKFYFSLSKMLIDLGEAAPATLEEVDSQEQRLMRQVYNFSVECEVTSKNQKRQTDVYQEIPDYNLSWIVKRFNSVIEVKVQSLLSWNRVVVHPVARDAAVPSYDVVEERMKVEAANQRQVSPIR